MGLLDGVMIDNVDIAWLSILDDEPKWTICELSGQWAHCYQCEAEDHDGYQSETWININDAVAIINGEL